MSTGTARHHVGFGASGLEVAGCLGAFWGSGGFRAVPVPVSLKSLVVGRSPAGLLFQCCFFWFSVLGWGAGEGGGGFATEFRAISSSHLLVDRAWVKP